MIHVALFGPPACGKGTQAERMSADHGFFHLSTGHLLREHVSWGTEIGREATKRLSAGQLVPDQVANAIVEETLEQVSEGHAGIVFDGYPRTLPQLEALEALLKRRVGRGLDLGLEIRIPEMEVISRASGRRECQECQTVFNTRLLGDQIACPSCGSLQSVRRDDDEPDIARDRLLSYERTTYPVLSQLRHENRLALIDGVGTPEEVNGRLEETLKPLLAQELSSE